MKRLHGLYVELVRASPTALFSRGDMSRLDEHVADGIIGTQVVAELAPTSIVDIGSGGGVPGMQLAIEVRDASIHLIESQHRKAQFLHACARALNLESRVRVYPLRVEEAVGELGREAIDVGTARALAAPIIVAEYLAPLIRVGGHLALWCSRTQVQDASVGPCRELGLGAPRIQPAPSALRSDGVILVWPKTAACEARFPRRVGVAARRPLR